MKYKRSMFLSLVLCFLAAAAMTVHSQKDPNFEVTLQLIVGTNNAEKRLALPADLAAVSRDLKKTLSFSNYYLGGTFFARVVDGGMFETRSVSDLGGIEVDTRVTSSLLEWTVGNIKAIPRSNGRPDFHTEHFRFSARLPIVSWRIDDTKNSVPLVNFEHVGMTFKRLSIAENTPTLVGTLNLPGSNGTIFLVMTAKSIEL